MSDEEPTRDELLDRTPEAEAMRRARERRAEAARQAAAPGGPDTRRRGRRWVVGAILGTLAAARVIERGVNGRRR